MIVSRQMAEQAMNDLGFAGWGFSEEEVQQQFRNAAKLAHPDKGGSPEAFAKIDRAKCVLLAWLSRPRVVVDAAISSEKCTACGGAGRRTVRRGFRTMTMVCGTCRGAGERVPPEKVEP